MGLARSYSFKCKNLKVARRDGRYKLWDVKILKDGQRSFLKGLDTKGALQISKESEDNMEIMVEGTRSLHLEKMLRDRDIPFEVVGTDFRHVWMEKCKSPKNRLIPHSSSLMHNRLWKQSRERFLNWRDFYPLNVIYTWMDEIEKEFPATCTVSIIGNSVEGRPIKMLKVSNSDAANTGAWLDGCCHAREWISVSVVTYIADHIVRNFGRLPHFITNKDWYFVPIMNPDGYNFTHTLDRLWRKNRARFGNTIVGVDLNRNFGFRWGQCGLATEGTSLGDPTHLNYRGQEPFSEPETTAIKDLILYAGIPFKIYLTFHAYSEVIAFPWCFTSDPCPDYVNLIEGGAAMAKAMQDTTGRVYKVGNFKDIMYYAAGTSIDWSYGTAKIPFSYLMELRSKEHKFQLPREEIEDCCKETLAATFALAEFVEKRKCLNCTVFASRQRE